MIEILAAIYVISVVVSLTDFVIHFTKNRELGYDLRQYLMTAFLIFTPVLNTIVALFIIF